MESCVLQADADLRVHGTADGSGSACLYAMQSRRGALQPALLLGITDISPARRI